MIYEFKQPLPVNVTELEFPNGSCDLMNMAMVRYEFKSTNGMWTNEVRLLIDDYYFGENDFDDLINLLKTMKAVMAKSRKDYNND